MKSRLQTYKVNWWGCPGSIMGRPTYRVLDIQNGNYRFRFTLVTGRVLGNYVLPYWPVTSFLSISSPPAEIAHQAEVLYSKGGEKKDLILRTGDATYSHNFSNETPPWASFKVASERGWTVIKVTNEGSKSPIHMEHYASIPDGEPFIGFTARTINGESHVEGLSSKIAYEQFFNWSDFGDGRGVSYRPARGSDDADAFYAFSKGMERGFEFIPGEGCGLSYGIDPGINGWRAEFSGPEVDLGPGEDCSFDCMIRVLRNPPGRVSGCPEAPDPLDLTYRTIIPELFRSTPVETYTPTSIEDVIDRLDVPKARGLNLRATFPRSLEDLDTLSKWGCNMIIWHLDDPDHVRLMCSRAHSLGMEALLQGRGGFDNPPSFEPLKGIDLGKDGLPDSFGQDEDHYYWYPFSSLDGFSARFGKDASLATLDEKAAHLSSLFADKWRGVLRDVRTINKSGGIWFYTPTPIVANVDPLDQHEAFMGEVKKLGRNLTVFPFYYGVDYGQVEYMVRSWKRDNPGRVVFLPMRDFMAKPSQFIRAITAARRAGADGVCGFSFAVGESEPGQDWQLRSVMLGALANFPTPDLGALCLIEEPAELLEELSRSEVVIVGEEEPAEELAARIGNLLPGKVLTSLEVSSKGDRLTIELDESPCLMGDGRPRAFISMQGRRVKVGGLVNEMREPGFDLLSRFAGLARAEARKVA